LGIRALSLYAFSTENWKRPDDELSVLWKLLRKFLMKEEANLMANGVRLRVIGELERLHPELQLLVQGAVERLSKNTGLQLTFAVSYGSRREITQAARTFAKVCVEKRLDPSSLTEEDFGQYLQTQALGTFSDVDLMIRTSGEMRISNFLLWQAAYAELHFTPVAWPDFTSEHLRAAVQEYALRERRFGATTPAQVQGAVS
jgi:undecaprenyl diphosphate synthase